MSDNPVLPEEWQTLSSPKIPEIKVWISMGGKVLTSHKKDTLDHTKVGAEIAGIEGREFEVIFYDGRTKLVRPYERRVYLDGKHVGGHWIRKDDSQFANSPEHRNRFHIYATKVVGKSHVKPFVFGAIGTTDEKSKATQSARALAEIGTIRIEYKRVKNVRQVRVSNKKKRKTYFSESDDGSAEEGQEHLLDEKAKKAQFGLSAGVGKKRKIETNRQDSDSDEGSGWTQEWKYDVADDVPYLTWTFRIRSPIGLQDDVLPDEETPQPVASTSQSSKRPTISLSDSDEDEEEDADALDARIAAIEAKAARLKAKRAKTAGAADIKPKVSPGPPFDWEGRPPIDKGKRIYVDFDEEGAEEEEKRMLEREKLEREKRERNRVEL